MKYTLSALAVIAALAATPAAAQLVNGANGANGSPPAPVGTKAGGSPSSMQAPGEAPATALAEKNNQEWKTDQQSPSGRHHARHKHAAMDTSGSSMTGQ